jgi:hypothetical protein
MKLQGKNNVEIMDKKEAKELRGQKFGMTGPITLE